MAGIISILKEFRHGVAGRLIIYILLFSSLVTCVGTILQLYMEYTRDLNSIDEKFHHIEESHLQGVITSLWVADRKLLRIQLEGILRLPDMLNLTIREDTRTLISMGTPDTEKTITRDYPMVYPYKGRNVPLGTLHVTFSLEGVYGSLVDRVLVILATQAVKTFLVSTFIFFIFHFLVGRHLVKMADYTRTMKSAGLFSPLILSRRLRKGKVKDELSQLAFSINAMREELARDIAERKRVEEELTTHRSRLEEMVAERTRNVEKSNKELQQEISRRKKSENELDSIIRTVPDIIYRSDPAGILTFISDAVTRYGYTPRELVGTSLMDIVHPDDRQHAEKRILERRTGTRKTQAYEVRLMNRKSEGVYFEVFSVSVEGLYDKDEAGAGGFSGSQGIAKDITQKKIAEEKIRRMNEELEEEVARRTQELIRTSDALKESMDTVRDTRNRLILLEKMAGLGKVVADSTHEINTPLGCSITTASFLGEKTRSIHDLYNDGKMARSDFETFLTATEESSKIIHANLSQAAELIRSLKVVAVDQCIDDRRSFLLSEYLDTIVLSLMPRLKNTDHSVSVNCPPNLLIENYPGAFFQIVTNLVINSLIHGFEGIKEGKILIDVEKREENIILAYSDDGRGIEKEHLGRIFDKYFTTKRTKGGSGLGTHIIHGLVTEKLKGEITCTSPPGGGTVFTITFPEKLPEPSP